jgi:polysaccharide biosynthesis/export protein
MVDERTHAYRIPHANALEDNPWLCCQIDERAIVQIEDTQLHVRVAGMKHSWSKRASLGLLLAVTGLGCAGVGEYVWADSLPEAPADAGGEYRLARGDLVYVRVYNQDPLSGRTRVRPDGQVTIPLVNDVPAAGRTTQELAKTLEGELRAGGFINVPQVTVFLEEMGPLQLSVMGEVARPGVYPVERGQGVLRALAAAGGLTEFAHKDRIFLVRAGTPGRIRFTLDGLSTPGSRSARFRLQNDDTILVQ